MNIIYKVLKIISWIWIGFWILIGLSARTPDGQFNLFGSVITIVICDTIPAIFLVWRLNVEKDIRLEKNKKKLEDKKEEQRIKDELEKIEKQENETLNKKEKEEIRIENTKIKEENRKQSVEVINVDDKTIFNFNCTGVSSKVTIDNNWLSIERSGFSNTMNYGRHGVKKLHIQDISGVQFKEAKNINGGYVELILKSYDKNVNNGVLGLDENRIMFTKQYNDLATELVKIIEDKIEEIRLNTKGTNITQQNTTTTAQQIREFKELLDQGIITQEEFDKKKSQLLNF